MPIEIKELVIRAVVGGDGGGGGGESPAPAKASAELVEACVREVLRVLQQSKER